MLEGSKIERFIDRYSRFIFKHPYLISFSSLLIAIIATYFSALLYQNLKTDLEELLPETAQSVLDLKAVVHRVGGLNHLAVLIESKDTAAGHKFAIDFTKAMNELPKDVVASVQNNIKESQEYFNKNKSLFIDLYDWIEIEKYVQKKIQFERTTNKKNPFSLGLVDKSESIEPKYDFEQLKTKYEKRAKDAGHFGEDGYFISKDKTQHVVLAFLPGKVTDIQGNMRLSEAASNIVRNLNPKKYATDLVVGFDGDVQNVIEEHHSILEDLVKSSIIVLLLVGLSLLWFYRSLTGTIALCLALFVGTSITFGASYFIIGYLNANTAFLGSIVLGNGINFGIILLARYFEERRTLDFSEKIISDTIKFTWQATWTAALAAGFAYLSLIITDFRGFNQFGVIGGLGMLFCWLASFITLPAMLIISEKRKLLKVPKNSESNTLLKIIGKFIEKRYRWILLAAAISIIICCASLLKYSSEETIETDFTKLRSKESLISGSSYWGKKVDAVFERYLTPTLILTDESRDTEVLVDTLKKLKEKNLGNSPVSQIGRVEDFLPKDQDEKIKLIQKIREKLTPKLLASLDSDQKKLVDELVPSQDPVLLTTADIPEELKFHFKEVDGKIGNIVHVFPKFDVGGFWDGREVIRFAKFMRQGLKESGVKAHIAGQPPLSADMISAINDDGPKATAIAFLAVTLLVVIIFRNLSYIRSVLGALFLGVLWLVGIIILFKLKINFLNFIALPITFGIGVDYAVNIFARYRLDTSQSMTKVIESTGGAVVMCSLTTVIGYGSLLIASNQAFNSFGVLAVLGEFTCLVAAIFVLPAFSVMFKR